MATETIEATDHKLLVAGEWIETGEWSEVQSPYDGTLIGRVPTGDAAVVDKAVDAARRGLRGRRLPPARAGSRPRPRRPTWSPSARTI